MVTNQDARPQLPPDLSPEEEAVWWDEHPEYWDAVESDDEVVQPVAVRRSAPANLYLPVDLLDALKREALARGMSHQWLIRTWLEERLKTGPDRPA
jgi:hypothetical protein